MNARLLLVSFLSCRLVSEEEFRFLQVAVLCEDVEDFQVAWYLRERLSTIASRPYLYEIPV